tara:strand:+ start:21312 stop:21485 length:174 start_codon:yes stop_codon:yes gene_type:complete
MKRETSKLTVDWNNFTAILMLELIGRHLPTQQEIDAMENYLRSLSCPSNHNDYSVGR